MRKRWGIAVLFIGMAAFGIVWWLSLNNWSFKDMVPRKEGQHFSQRADSVDFSGVYAIHGPGYTGTLTIRRAGDGYNLCWQLSSGSVYYGFEHNDINILKKNQYLFSPIDDARLDKGLVFSKL